MKTFTPVLRALLLPISRSWGFQRRWLPNNGCRWKPHSNNLVFAVDISSIQRDGKTGRYISPERQRVMFKRRKLLRGRLVIQVLRMIGLREEKPALGEQPGILNGECKTGNCEQPL